MHEATTAPCSPPANADSETIAAVFKALGHPVRLCLVQALRAGPACVSELAAISQRDSSTISRHLCILESAGVLRCERQGTTTWCHIALPCLNTLLDCLDGRCHGGSGAADV